MCVPIVSSLGSIFLLFSFVLELFILIGQAGNTSFLRKLNFIVTKNQPQNLTYTTGLWNYCQGDYQGVISSCTKGTPAYNWAQTPGISQVLPNQANSWFIKSLFLAMFCLFFIGCGLSFILWCLSIPMCCLKRRSFHFSLGTFTFINFLVMLAALILSLVMIISGSKQLHDADNNWFGKAGDSLWCAIGAVVSLLIATLFFGGGGCCHKRSNKKVDTVAPETKVQAAPVPYPQDTKQQYVTSATYIPHDQYQPDIKYAQQMPQGQTQTYYVAHPSYPKLPVEPYADGTKHVYVSGQTGQTVDPYTGSPIVTNNQHVYQDQTVQRAVETQSPRLNTTTVTSQGQVPNATDTTNTATANVTRNISASGDKTIYIPTDQGPVPVDPNAVSSNLQTVDSSGNPIVKP